MSHLRRMVCIVDVNKPRISRRLRDSLVADLVMEDIESDYWLTHWLDDPEE